MFIFKPVLIFLVCCYTSFSSSKYLDKEDVSEKLKRLEYSFVDSCRELEGLKISPLSIKVLKDAFLSLEQIKQKSINRIKHEEYGELYDQIHQLRNWVSQKSKRRRLYGSFDFVPEVLATSKDKVFKLEFFWPNIQAVISQYESDGDYLSMDSKKHIVAMVTLWESLVRENLSNINKDDPALKKFQVIVDKWGKKKIDQFMKRNGVTRRGIPYFLASSEKVANTLKTVIAEEPSEDDIENYVQNKSDLHVIPEMISCDILHFRKTVTDKDFDDIKSLLLKKDLKTFANKYRDKLLTMQKVNLGGRALIKGFGMTFEQASDILDTKEGEIIGPFGKEGAYKSLVSVNKKIDHKTPSKKELKKFAIESLKALNRLLTTVKRYGIKTKF